jgi:hypothetical protein
MMPRRILGIVSLNDLVLAAGAGLGRCVPPLFSTRSKPSARISCRWAPCRYPHPRTMQSRMSGCSVPSAEQRI